VGSLVYWLWRIVRGKVRRCWCCSRWRDTQATCTRCGDHALACECWACDIDVDDDGNVVLTDRSGPSVLDLHAWVISEQFARTLRRSSLELPDEA